jgi:Domain of unknown function (DUF397)
MVLTQAIWRKSTYSSGNGGNCVEVARNLPGVVAVRDSKDPDGPALGFPAVAWAEFIGEARAGEFDMGGPLTRSA